MNDAKLLRLRPGLGVGPKTHHVLPGGGPGGGDRLRHPGRSLLAATMFPSGPDYTGLIYHCPLSSGVQYSS